MIFSAACSAPTAPVPPPSTNPLPIQPPVNVAPVISSITASAARAEVDEWIAISADVADPETALDKLTYTWTAEVGEFAGTGRAVMWRLPQGRAMTPLDLRVTLTVIETYDSVDSAGLPIKREHRVERSATLSRVHDSKAELSAMAVHFLVDLFGDSSVRPEMCVADFSDACRGKAEELRDIEHNRSEFLILSATARVTSVTLDAARTSGSLDLACSFRDRHLPSGKEGTSEGTCRIGGIYEQGRWWLCTSTFAGICGSCDGPAGLRRMTMREFFLAGIRDR